MISIQHSFDFQLLPAYAMGLVPVNLSLADTSTLKTDLGDPFEFAPFGRAVLSAKPHDVSDSSTTGNRLNILNIAYYIKMHTKARILFVGLLCINHDRLSIVLQYCRRNSVHCQDMSHE